MSRFIINSVPFATRLRATLGAKELLERDRKRAAKFLAGLSPHGPIKAFRQMAVASTASGDSIDVTDSGEFSRFDTDSQVYRALAVGVTYTMPVNVGNPPTQYSLLIDTGSSNTWVGASTPYNPTSTSQDTGNTVVSPLAELRWHWIDTLGRRTSVTAPGQCPEKNVGISFLCTRQTEADCRADTDTVTLNQVLVIQNQSIGVASSAQGFSGVDGILGVGPVDLTQGTVSNTTEVPTVTDNLYAQDLISTNSLGIFYEPSSTTDVTNGELTFGGTDNSKYTGKINFVPITSTSPASNYWGIDQSVTYGGSNPLLQTTAGIVDTGTTLLLLATDAFQAYQQATGATLDQTTGLLTITEKQYQQLQSIYFNIGGVTYELTPNAQIWPRALNSVLGGQEGQIYLITSDLGSPSGSGLDFINGFGWLQRFYSVFDTGNRQVGLATTPYTNANTN
ncbi:acid protease [Lanmaoa asiatica]|nr:acid protease [Lanmaoa asiatica]